MRRAVAIGDALFPVKFTLDTPDLVGVSVGLLARCVTTTKACEHLAALGRRGDLMVCVRTLFEHTVMLAWLLGSDDGEQRMLLWQRYCDEETLKFDNERARLGGDKEVGADARAEIDEADRRLGKLKMPGLPERAAQVDREWAERLGLDPQHRSPWSLRHIYSIVFRVGSAMAHPTLAGLQLVTEKHRDGVLIDVERPGLAHEALFPVPVLIGTALAVSSVALGKPHADDINAQIDWLIDVMDAAG